MTVLQTDIKARMAQNFSNDQAGVWERIKAYYISIGRGDFAEKIYLVDHVEFYDDDYGIVLTDFQYDAQNPSYTPIIAFDQQFTNNSDVQDSMSPSFTQTETSSFSFQFTEGLTVGVKATVSAKIPVIGEGELEVSGSISFSATQQWTTTKTRTWSSSTTVNVPPHSSVQVTGFIRQATSTATFSGKARVTRGDAMVWFGVKQTGTGTQDIIPVTVFLTEDQRTVAVAGTYEGVEGVQTYWYADPLEALLPVKDMAFA